MITFYTYPGPNARKAQIMLEESGEAYQAVTVDIKKGEQFDPKFLAISPNNKIPAIVDHTADGPVPVFETAAILTYLAEKSGRLLPAAGAKRYDVLAWLVWGTGSVGGTLPQLHHYSDLPDRVPGTVERFNTEAVRLFKVLERRLQQNEYICGDYSIADIPTFCSTAGWLQRVKGWSDGALGDTPAIDRWLKAVAARPAVQRVG
ncbi:glutathione S-transferase family protein [Hydrogenophaga sp. T2]|jgi:GSH-dependent disulfide-bond oxidoreductase|uniref:glutathione S-transferase family protein n=1 Tax=Hydrogenophaga sp. T2 TaxID=3132823 RepID=UPI003CEFD913